MFKPSHVTVAVTFALLAGSALAHNAMLIAKAPADAKIQQPKDQGSGGVIYC